MRESEAHVEFLGNDQEIEVIDYDLGPEEGVIDHDQMCVSQANKLLQIGYLEYETAVYGCAYYKNDEINYYISAKDETMEKFQYNCYQQNIFPTPAKYFFKRYDLVNETKEEIKAMFRLETARSLKSVYPVVLFQAIDALTKTDSSNAAFAFMQELVEQLDSCFDLNQLNLFGDLAEMLFRGRMLTKESSILLKQWLNKEYEKISIEPIASGDYRRTYSGFAYKKPQGEMKYFIDAFPYMAQEKQSVLITRGYIVTPILKITYYADSFNNLQNVGDDFMKATEQHLGAMYMRLMELFRTLPAAVDQELYQVYLEQIKATGSKQALEAYLYYGYQWNIKF